MEHGCLTFRLSVPKSGVLYQMKGGADGEWGLWESGVEDLVLG